jgi:acyl-CoA synthetase (AMP-forming)/AMP-acid ligase II
MAGGAGRRGPVYHHRRSPVAGQIGQTIQCGRGHRAEGYGLSEASPGISVTRVEEEGRMIGTVGIPLNNVHVKLAEERRDTR